VTLTADDPDGDAIHFRIIRGPRHGTLSGGAEDGQLRYTPDRNFNGQDRIVFQAYDKKSDSKLAVVTFAVAPVNDAPQALDLHVHADGPVTGRLFGYDVDGDRLTFRLVNAPDRGSVTINAKTGVFTYTPDRRRPAQVDTFDFVVNDGQTDSRPATVRVEPRKGKGGR
jgi:hypothetical protein